MKVLILARRERYDAYGPEDRHGLELVFRDRGGTEEEWLAAGGDAEALVVTPVTAVTEHLIARMPNLRMIHSEGVGYDRIDLEAARKRGIYVCNNAGCNADAVAELAVMLMSMLLHRTPWGHRMMREGRHSEATRALEQGMDVVTLSRLLGHANPSITLDKYGHALDDHKRESMERLDTLYDAAAPTTTSQTQGEDSPAASFSLHMKF